MAEVVELRPSLHCEHIPTVLRSIADDIEAGAYDFVPTLGVLVIGCEAETRDRHGVTLNFNWQTHGLGKTSFFASKGLLAAATASFEGNKG